MSQAGKTLGFLVAFLILIAGVAFYFLTSSSDAPLPGFTVSDSRLVSEGAFDPRSVKAIEIATSATSMRLVLSGTGWEVANKGGFPASDGFADDLIQRLAQARVLYERRTEHDDLRRFGLQSVTEPSSSAARISLRDEADEPLLDIRIGNQMSLPGGSDIETLAAVPAQRRIVVLDQAFDFAWASSAWLQPLDLNLSTDDVIRVEMGTQTAEPQQEFERREERGWIIPTPSGEEIVESQSILETMVSALSYVEPLDVRSTDIPASDVQWRRTIRLETAFGAAVEYEVVRTADRDWVRVAAISEQCGDPDRCAALERQVSILDGWWLQIPISTGSEIEVAYVLRD